MPKVGAYGVAVNPTTDKVYITNADFNSVTVMSSRTDKIIDTISVGSSPRGITVNPVTNNVYVANYESDSVTVIESTIDGVKDKVVTTIPVGSTPYGIAVNPATNKVYVANSGSNSVSVIDISINRTNRVIDTIEVGHNPVGVAINQNTNMIYVTNFNSNSVSMIDGSADEVMDTIEVGHNPSGIDINSRTDIVYVANYGSNSVSVIDTKNTLMSVEGNESKLTDNETSVHVDAPERFYIDVDGERDYAEITSDAFISGFQYEGELKKISFTVESEEESKTVLTIPKQFSIEPPDVFTTGYIFPPVVTHGNDGWTIMLKHEQGSHDVVIQGVGANVVATTESEDSSTLSGKNNSTLDGIANWFTDFLNSILKFLGLSSVQR